MGTEEMSNTKYTVGWHSWGPEFLGKIPLEYRDSPIEVWGKTEATWFDTPGEAQWFLDQIVKVNSESNLRSLTPTGAEGLFIVEVEPTNLDYPRFRYVKYTHPGGAHLIPEMPSRFNHCLSMNDPNQ